LDKGLSNAIKFLIYFVIFLFLFVFIITVVIITVNIRDRNASEGVKIEYLVTLL